MKLCLKCFETSSIFQMSTGKYFYTFIIEFCCTLKCGKIKNISIVK